MAPTSAVTALLYYFGWARTSVQAQQMGLDDSLLGYSTQDYLLRSLTSMTVPLVVALVATVVGLLLHTVVVRWLAEGSKPDGPGMADRRAQVLLRGLVGGIAALGLVLLLVGLVGSLPERPSTFVFVATPVCVTVGMVMVLYAANLWRKARGPAVRAARPPELQGIDLLISASLVMLLMVSLFWNVSHYAAVKGHQLARTFEEQVATSQPSVVVYSAKRLYLQAPVVETRLDPENAAYNYAYTGLKLLFRADRRYFLRPGDPSSQANIVIPEALDIRLEFYKS